jgi:hypothetical protein
VIFPSACRSAEQDTAIATGQEAPCREPDDPHVVAEVLAAELRADPHLPGDLKDLLLQASVPEPVPGRRTGLRQRVQVARRRVLGGLQRVLGAGAAHHDGQVIGRARGRPERADLLPQEGEHAGLVQNRLRLLVQERLVGRAAALGHEQELVLIPAGSVDLDLGRQVAAGVALVPHGQRGQLGVPQVQLRVGVIDAARDVLLVPPVGEHVLAALAHHDRGPGVLAHGQHAPRRDARVLQQVERDVPVVRAGLGVAGDGAQLTQVAGPQQVRDIPHRRPGQQGEDAGVDLEKISPERLTAGQAARVQLAVVGVIRTSRQQFGKTELGHRRGSSSAGHGCSSS